MTFEARDSAAKSILQRTHKPLTHMNTTGSSIHRHKVSPNRTDSSRRHTGPGNPGELYCWGWGILAFEFSHKYNIRIYVQYLTGTRTVLSPHIHTTQFLTDTRKYLTQFRIMKFLIRILKEKTQRSILGQQNNVRYRVI